MIEAVEGSSRSQELFLIAMCRAKGKSPRTLHPVHIFPLVDLWNSRPAVFDLSVWTLVFFLKPELFVVAPVINCLYVPKLLIDSAHVGLIYHSENSSFNSGHTRHCCCPYSKKEETSEILRILCFFNNWMSKLNHITSHSVNCDLAVFLW